MPELKNPIYLSTRVAWRRWLEENYQTADEVWLVYPRKHTGRPRIPYNDAVEEALCFGWIDSIIRSVDEEATAQRFTPRSPRSTYSQTNVERLRRLIDQGKVMPEILPAVREVVAREFRFPADIRSALQANERAWRNFRSFSPAYQRIRIAYVETARKRPDDFQKRLDNLIRKTEQGKQFGYGIESYY